MIPQSPVLRGAVVGFGNMGQKFARRVQETAAYGARIVAATNRGLSNLEVARDEFGLEVSHHVEDVMEGLDFVIIASTTSAHADQVVAAAEAGCHVFCEKPVALTLEDADRMIAAVERAGVISVVNYITRFNPAYLALADMVRGGAFGRLLSVTHTRMRGYGLYAAGARHRAVMEQEESGGWTVHHACHDLDLLHWLGGPVREVFAYHSGSAPADHSEEVVSGLVRFASGAHGMIEDSVCAIRDHYTRIIGERASVVVAGENDETRFRLHREGADRAEILPIEDRKRPGGGLDHFFDCIRSGRISDCDLASARPSLAAALAMRESVRRGVPVAL